MNELIDNTFTAYLGVEFQQRLMWQLLVEPEFSEKIIPNLAVEYFDDPNLKRLFLIILEFIDKYDKAPNLQNQSILQAINEFKSPNNIIEEESLFSVIERIKLWNERVLNKQLLHDGDVVQKATNTFIKQQEYRKLGEFILDKTKNGDIKLKNTLGLIDDKIQKISHIGDDEDDGTDVTEGIEKALRKEFRQTIPTGIEVLDQVTGGGLGKAEVGLVLCPTGAGKTTLLTKIANTARENDYNVLQIVFDEDTEDQIKRKHYTIWTGIPLSKIDNDNDYVIKKVNEKIEKLGNKGKLTIKRFSGDGSTMKDIRIWMTKYQKKCGFKFDIVVLDYLDCLESHKKNEDRNEAELTIIKSFISMAADFDIPAWSALQSNRCLALNTNVNILKRGNIEIGNVKLNDKILTHLGYKKIIKIFPIQKQKVFKIKLKCGKEIICSNKHNFPTINGLKSINFGLEIGDKLYINNDLELIEDEIIIIEPMGIEETIDIIVEDTHMFFANDIYTHNSGIDAELVEAQHTGGSIKRVQKSHFFMSIAKTPDQKEAHLANIRIIKARFAQDGQTFKDCIFNNDTMQIIIRDERYSGVRVKGLKKYGDEEIEKIENNIIGIDHAKISNAISFNTTLNNFNGEGNKTIGDFLEIDETKQIENINNKNNMTDNEIKINDNIINIETNLIENTNNVENNNIINNVDDENKIIENEIFYWTGKTETKINNTTNIEIKINDVNPIIINDNTKLINIEKINNQNDVIGKNNDDNKIENINVYDLKKSLSGKDEISMEHKHVFDMLLKQRQKQGNILKE